jgi:hypothetical protein
MGRVTDESRRGVDSRRTLQVLNQAENEIEVAKSAVEHADREGALLAIEDAMRCLSAAREDIEARGGRGT